MSTFKLLLGDKEPILCDWQPQPGWSQTLTSKLPPQLAVRDYWYNPDAPYLNQFA